MIYKCKYFKLQELVSPAVYNKFGEFAWSFFREDVLRDLDTIREKWGDSITINNWMYSGTLTQCGLRTNADPIVKVKNTPYCSGHVLGNGFDLHCKNVKDTKFLWDMCYKLISDGTLKAFTRLEDFKCTPTWVHTDALQTCIKPQIFKV